MATNQHPLTVERRRRGWTQAKLADKAGCSVQTVSRLEAGTRLDHSLALLRVANALEVAPHVIAGPSQMALAEELERAASIYISGAA